MEFQPNPGLPLNPSPLSGYEPAETREKVHQRLALNLEKQIVREKILLGNIPDLPVNKFKIETIEDRISNLKNQLENLKQKPE